MTEPQSRLPQQRAKAQKNSAGRMDPPRHNVFVEPPTSGRIDPPVAHVDAVSPWGLLDHKDPARHYVYANGATQNVGGVQWYKILGYQVEVYKPGGVCPRGGETDSVGQPITVMGNVLMSCSKERKAELDAVGYDGSSGQRAVDEIENLIIDPDGGVDESRGLYGRRGKYFSVHNETKPIEGVS